jgi:TAG lipase/steryl ester hydrolase/phospholipase A2/LPA acyltransferase
MDMERLTQALQRDLGDMTFYEAYDRTGRIINITVSPVNGFEKPRLLNYLTAPNVLLWSAAASSCYLPGFKTPELVARTPDGDLRPYSGVSSGSSSSEPWGSEERLGAAEHTDLPMQRLQELFNVNFFVVSQVCFNCSLA